MLGVECARSSKALRSSRQGSPTESLGDLNHRTGRSSSRGLNWLEEVLRSAEGLADGPSSFEDRSSTKPGGISIRSRNVGRARRRQTPTMKRPRRQNSHRSRRDQRGARPQALASGEALSVGPFDALFPRSKPSMVRVMADRSSDQDLNSQL